MKNLKALNSNLISITGLVLLLSGCSDAGFISNPGATGNETPTPEEPGSPAKILPLVTIESPSNNTRLNYENFSSVEASGTCNQKDRLVKLSISGKSYGSAMCDGTNWNISRLPSLSDTLPGNLKLEAVLTDEDGNSATATRDLVRAPADRVVTLSTQSSTIVTKNKLKIFLIIDNSSSMAEEQSRLAEGIRRLTLSLQGFEAQIFVYTTTVYGTKGVASLSPSYNFISNGVATSSPIQPAEPIPYHFVGTLTLTNPLGDFTFNPSLSRSDFEKKTEDLENLVKSIGINGSNNEAGLLSMLHILTAADFETKFKTSLSNGDKAAFLILSDADDKSYVEQARNFSLYGRTRNWANINRYEDDVSYSTVSTKKDVLTSLSDATFVRAFANLYAAEVRTYGLCSGDPCESGINYRPITQAEIALVNFSAQSSVDCPASYVTKYQNETGLKVSRCKFTSTNYRYIDFYENLTTDFCSNPFTMTANAKSNFYPSDGKTFANLYDWINKTQIYLPVPGSCVRQSFKSQQVSSYSPLYANGTLIPKANAQIGQIEGLIKMKLTEKFGAKGFLVSAIVNKPNEGSTACQQAAEGQGNQYLNFLSGLGEQGFSDTICKDDYSAALNSISTFAEQVIRDRMEISLGNLESVKSVTINRNGQSIIVPTADFSTVVEAGKIFLAITKGVLKVGDSLYISVQSK